MSTTGRPVSVAQELAERAPLLTAASLDISVQKALRWENSISSLVMNSSKTARPSALILRAPLERRDDLRRLLDALGVTAHGAAEVGVVAADVAGPVAVVRDDQRMALDRHRGVVEHDRGDGDAAAHGGLEVEAGHPKGGIAHEVHAELVGRRDLGPDVETEAGAQRVRLAPSHVAAGRGGPVEWDQLLAWAAGVVGDDRVAGVDRLDEVPHHAVRGERDFT